MELTIRLFAGLRERAGTENLVLSDLPEDLDVAGLKRVLAERHPELGSLASVRGVVGTTYVAEDTKLTTGDAVSFLPPVSGGATDGDDLDARLAAGVFALTPDPIDPLELQRMVTHPSCGAVVLFTGVTRETNRERDVVELDYSAFAEMAGAEMARVYEECVAKFGPDSDVDDRPPKARILRMVTHHRTGVVGVGEPSIVIAVASPHRDTAYSASRFLIDELKARVPLWKKEMYADGHHWIGERS